MLKSKHGSKKIEKLIDWAYEKSFEGLPGTYSAIELADSVYNPNDSLLSMANKIIRKETSKASISGFITGLGGLLTMSFMIPASLVGVTFLQMRMVAAIAHLAGFDLKDKKVKTFVLLSWTVGKTADLLKNVGAKFASHTAGELLVKGLSEEAIKIINETALKSIVQRLSVKGAEEVTYSIPLLASIVGASFDGISTLMIGNRAKQIFIVRTSKEEDNNRLEEHLKLEYNKIALYINLIKIDGKLQRQEIKVIEKLIVESDLPKVDKRTFGESLWDCKLIQIDFALLNNHPLEKHNILYTLLDLAKVDGEIAERELNYIRLIAKKLNVSDRAFGNIFNTEFRSIVTDNVSKFDVLK